jgi:hypothetical protein
LRSAKPWIIIPLIAFPLVMQTQSAQYLDDAEFKIWLAEI